MLVPRVGFEKIVLMYEFRRTFSNEGENTKSEKILLQMTETVLQMTEISSFYSISEVPVFITSLTRNSSPLSNTCVAGIF